MIFDRDENFQGSMSSLQKLSFNAKIIHPYKQPFQDSDDYRFRIRC